jgi:hypothetical protein
MAGEAIARIHHTDTRTDISLQPQWSSDKAGVHGMKLLDNATVETTGLSIVDELFQHEGGASRGWLIWTIMQGTGLGPLGGGGTHGNRQ